MKITRLTGDQWYTYLTTGAVHKICIIFCMSSCQMHPGSHPAICKMNWVHQIMKAEWIAGNTAVQRHLHNLSHPLHLVVAVLMVDGPRTQRRIENEQKIGFYWFKYRQCTDAACTWPLILARGVAQGPAGSDHGPHGPNLGWWIWGVRHSEYRKKVNGKRRILGPELAIYFLIPGTNLAQGMVSAPQCGGRRTQLTI